MRVRSRAKRMAKMSPRQIKQMEKKISKKAANNHHYHGRPSASSIARSIHKKMAKQFEKKTVGYDSETGMPRLRYDVVVDSDNPSHIDVRVGHTRLLVAAQEIVDATCKHKLKIGACVARLGIEY